MPIRLIPAFLLSLLLGMPALAQDADAPIQQLLQEQSDLIVQSSRRTIEPAIAAIRDSDLPEAQRHMLEVQQVLHDVRGDKLPALFKTSLDDGASSQALLDHLINA